MKKAVAVGLAAVALIGLALFLKKAPADGPKPRPTPSSEPRENAPAPTEPSLSSATAPVERPAAADPRRLLGDLAKALRNGDEKTARDVLRRLHDQLYPPIPDEQNGAALYQKAFDLAREKLGGLSMKGLDPAIYSAAITAKELTPEQSAAVRSWFDQNGAAAVEVLALLREAGRRPHCRFPEPSPKLVTQFSYACNFLHVAAVLDANPDHALGGLEMARAVRSSPDLVSQLIGCAFDSLTLESLQGALKPTSPQIAEWLEAADPASVRDAYLRALLGDIDTTVTQVLGAPNTDGPLTYQNLAAYVEGHQEFAALAGRPYHEVREEIDALARKHGELAPWYAELSRGLAPAMPGLSRAIARSEANATMAKLSLEMERYRDKHGSYPATLDALGGTSPRDPFTGQPFAYRREGGGFVIEGAGDGKKPLVWIRR